MTQLYAKIKKSSQYAHQHDGKIPFAVEIGVGVGAYIVFTDNNRYRIEDLRFYAKVGDRFVALS